ncbi:MAG: Ldh family oxidoreductase [bacterium]|nr:Ldh family oxidoreductase [bacterium]
MILAVDDLRALCQKILTDRHMSSSDAHIVADILIEAELRGRPTHGVIRMPAIADRVTSSARKPMLLAKDGPVSASVDGQDNLGYLVAHRCARTVIGKADRTGMGVVAGFNTGHCGMLGYYASMIADAGLVGLVMADTSPRVVPWGGVEPVLGTNPIAAGFPAPKGQILVDLSTAAITSGEILVALKDGQQIPEGSALGPDGKMTTDPDVARKGGVLPFGEHKGYALGMMIQLFSGVLTGAAPLPRPGQNYGIFMLALSTALFVEESDYLKGVGDVVARIKRSLHAEGVEEILVPGERAFREREMRLHSGIGVDDDLVTALRRLSE